MKKGHSLTSIKKKKNLIPFAKINSKRIGEDTRAMINDFIFDTHTKLQNEFIGIISVFYKYYKDLSRLEMSISIKKEYRNKKIGEFCYDYVIRNYFEDYDIKSIHLSIREDNIKSRKLAEKLGFKLYLGYKDSKYFVDSEGNKIPQVQYLLKRKDYIK